MNNEFWKKYFGHVIGLAPNQSLAKTLLKKGCHSKRLINEESLSILCVGRQAFVRFQLFDSIMSNT